MTDFKEQAERLIDDAETQDMGECIEALATALSDAREAGRREEREECAKIVRRAAIDAKVGACVSVSLRKAPALRIAAGLLEDLAAAIRSREVKANPPSS